METHMLLLKVHKQMKFSGVAETNWEQFFIYLNFNYTIQWIHTYLALLYPKDQMITLKTQKYLIKFGASGTLQMNIYAIA